jgi:RNA polymerase sigma-70 factor (ECF subfamily)
MGEHELARLKAGDQTAFKSYYQAYVGLVYYVATRAGLGKDEAEDVAQETFVRLFQRASEIREAAKVQAWLTVTAKNLAIDKLRAAKRFAPELAEGALDEDKHKLWRNRAGDGRELELLLVGQLLDKLAQTPGGETLKQFYADGMSAKEIAAQNGEAISTVTTRLSRLRAKFKEELRRHIEDLRARRVE